MNGSTGLEQRTGVAWAAGACKWVKLNRLPRGRLWALSLSNGQAGSYESKNELRVKVVPGGSGGPHALNRSGLCCGTQARRVQGFFREFRTT